ncbi:MAG: hypothetical protein OIF50_02730 [Flavobacteriaceae bacterium]|nr:hypothetical protein [Flavobacteriaceae bacterium]
MILKGLKHKAGYKTLKKQLSFDNQSSRKAGEGIRSLGCLVDLDWVEDIAIFYELSERLRLKSNAIKILGYRHQVDNIERFSVPMFSEKDLGWRGEIKNGYALEFLSYDFDLLINYYHQPILPLMLMSSKAKSRLKVGFSSVEEDINNLILSNKVNSFSRFEEELVKYLKILKEI